MKDATASRSRREFASQILPVGNVADTTEQQTGVCSMKAVWNGRVIAESDDTVVVEGNHYFPRAALPDDLVAQSETTTICSWKGTAHYYHLTVAGETNRDAVWYYPSPKPAAREIEGRVAFWHGVEVTD